MTNVRVFIMNIFGVFESNAAKLSITDDRTLCRGHKRTDGVFQNTYHCFL